MSTLTPLRVERGAYVSALDLFSVGIGPSSSHTVGPMRAGLRFRGMLAASGELAHVDRYEIVLHGSLAATGVGHGTPDAAIAGLRGLDPLTVDPGEVHGSWQLLDAGGEVRVDRVAVRRGDVQWEPRARDHGHPNAVTFRALGGGRVLEERTYLSVGGGFIRDKGEPARDSAPVGPLPHRFSSMSELLELCRAAGGDHPGEIARIARENELAQRTASGVDEGLDAVWRSMVECLERGLSTHGVLPGRLAVPRRAARAWAALVERGDAVAAPESLSVYAMAVNEENASGGRVVTAPTNGAAGVIPAVMYHALGGRSAARADVHRFLLTATTVGSIIKANASISGAEGGCQAEVGSACAMAAAGLTAVRGGTPLQIENAAEIAIEHHLGLTCDPVGGLVQIPCIERNAVAAATAVTAARLALLGDGRHVVGLDVAVETMRQTGRDMSHRYKETSEGGLAVNVVEC
ncbi:L-serine ammonia-lyase [Microbacterium oleivorans]|uniref:L-serine dehydratase n=1 Tax=Microbacterium oleivorans TaxID=273677 RepID=A0A7D5EWX5_9MICO|nr:L-serine ammonia-lyase [Microbacterium oleivorans]QLD12251.1 L-serine ammonia-lyase [Microbacterium oleivorans]